MKHTTLLGAMLSPALLDHPGPAQSPPAPAVHGDAEYAVRWRPGGDIAAELADTIARLRRDDAAAATLPPAKNFSIAYYDVAPAAWPDGYAASLRERVEKKNGKEDVELTYKVRGPAPLPSPFPTVPGSGLANVDRQEETDVTVVAARDRSVRNASISCSIKPKKVDIVPEPFATMSGKRPCTIAMTRYKLPWKAARPDDETNGREDLKIETWTFATASGAHRVLIEVSWKGTTDPRDEDAFRAAVQPLIDRLPDGVPPSKERTAAECDADTWTP
jgi:hypothetical protein